MGKVYRIKPGASSPPHPWHHLPVCHGPGNSDVSKEAVESLLASLPKRVVVEDIIEKYGIRMGNVGWGAAGAAVMATTNSHKNLKENGPYAQGVGGADNKQ